MNRDVKPDHVACSVPPSLTISLHPFAIPDFVTFFFFVVLSKLNQKIGLAVHREGMA